MPELTDALILQMLRDLDMPVLIVPESFLRKKKKKSLSEGFEDNIQGAVINGLAQSVVPSPS